MLVKKNLRLLSQGKILLFRLIRGKTSGHLLKTYFVYFFVAILMVITKVVIARMYGQTELGVYSYFFAIASFLFLWTSFEFPEALTQLIVKGKHDLKQIFWLTNKWILLTTTIVLSGLCLIDSFVYPLFASYLYLFLAIVLFVVSYTVYYQLYSMLRGDKQFAKSSAFSLVWRALFVLGILFFAYLKYPFWKVLILLSVCVFIAALSMLPSVASLWRKSKNSVEHFVSSPKLWKLAFALFLVQVGFYSLRTIDLYVLERMLSFSSVGFYSAYASFTNVIRLLAYVFPVVVLPMAAVSTYKIRKSLLRLLVVIIPFAAVVLALTVWFVPIFYGVEYLGGFWLSFTLVLSATVLLVYSYCSSIFAGENEVGSSYLWVLGIDFLLSLVGNAVLSYYLIGWYGIIGAPIATAIVVFVKVIFLLGAIKWFRIQGKIKKKII